MHVSFFEKYFNSNGTKNQNSRMFCLGCNSFF
ncbi:hypothetical protein CAEBREN_31695 [Caenorhabditis brenneri]|uniref:Uncharacterized protein n=1 Tax=Caenorhabditis brenneri TaxID=135651 RepID=G0MY28_CAEBE|nr:hypothetical protein CAEBREN_31695 [Caenorhabditis brenneri]